MAQFRVYRIAPDNGLAVDLQNDLFDGLSTRVMAPLAPVQDVTKLVPRLNPRFEIDGMVFAMMTQFIATVPVPDIGPTVIDLSARADEITAATDFLFQGF
ncbi:CcdB family protein [Peteryoungia desertarenae]|uniref:Toxin CcdB n=1 Tax=Peteryoungia desertarenae TaxID=1813451 RepID=A0ABX6QKC3_9HYPH|nr:CcdB family protein [Peteryoungia desertarenae]QLF68922.1 CcdB family protein [Peteryoungia desertarenae]